MTIKHGNYLNHAALTQNLKSICSTAFSTTQIKFPAAVSSEAQRSSHLSNASFLKTRHSWATSLHSSTAVSTLVIHKELFQQLTESVTQDAKLNFITIFNAKCGEFYMILRDQPTILNIYVGNIFPDSFKLQRLFWSLIAKPGEEEYFS